jgi:small subunit ribosomal protein S1
MTEVESAPEAEHQDESTADMETLLKDHAEYDLPRPGDIREGEVIRATPNEILIDIGLKREGLVSQEDLQMIKRDKMQEVEVGDKVSVLILRPQDNDGYAAVSIFKARMAEDWQRAEELMESKKIFEAEISGYNRGGLTIQFGRIRGFIPLSHIVGMPRNIPQDERRERQKAMVGRSVGLRVIEVDRRRRRLILSQRLAHRAWQRKRKRELLDELEVGERRVGHVTSITDFGVFVDVGGADGLVHLSELSWGRVDDAHEVCSVGDELEVAVLSIDKERERIGLSLKQTKEDPWATVGERYREGNLIEGKVTQVSSIGAFVEVEPGVEGLLHVSELVGAPAVVPEEVLKAGDKIPVKVIRVESNRRRIGLSARRVSRSEWEHWAAENVAEGPAETEEEPTPEPEEEPAQVAEAAEEPADEAATEEPAEEPAEESEPAAEEPTEEPAEEPEPAAEEPTEEPAEESEPAAEEPAAEPAEEPEPAAEEPTEEPAEESEPAAEEPAEEPADEAEPTEATEEETATTEPESEGSEE